MIITRGFFDEIVNRAKVSASFRSPYLKNIPLSTYSRSGSPIILTIAITLKARVGDFIIHHLETDSKKGKIKIIGSLIPTVSIVVGIFVSKLDICAFNINVGIGPFNPLYIPKVVITVILTASAGRY